MSTKLTVKEMNEPVIHFRKEDFRLLQLDFNNFKRRPDLHAAIRLEKNLTTMLGDYFKEITEDDRLYQEEKATAIYTLASYLKQMDLHRKNLEDLLRGLNADMTPEEKTVAIVDENLVIVRIFDSAISYIDELESLTRKRREAKEPFVEYLE